MSVSVEKLNPRYEPSLTCDICRKGCEKGDIFQLYQRRREGVSIFHVHQSCIEKRIAKAAPTTFDEPVETAFAQPVSKQ